MISLKISLKGIFVAKSVISTEERSQKRQKMKEIRKKPRESEKWFRERKEKLKEKNSKRKKKEKRKKDEILWVFGKSDGKSFSSNWKVFFPNMRRLKYKRLPGVQGCCAVFWLLILEIPPLYFLEKFVISARFTFTRKYLLYQWKNPFVF